MCIRVPDPILQCRVHAAVRERCGAPYDPHATKALLRQRLPDYAVPEVIHVVADFARGASGKVDRRRRTFRPRSTFFYPHRHKGDPVTTSQRPWDVVVIGAGGAKAQAMLAACARGTDVSRWLAVDRAWRAETRTATEALGIATTEQDALTSAEQLRELLGSARLGGALLGAKHGCRAGEAEQRAGDVVGQDDLDATEVHSAAVIDAVSVAYRTVTGAEWSRS